MGYAENRKFFSSGLFFGAVMGGGGFDTVAQGGIGAGTMLYIPRTWVREAKPIRGADLLPIASKPSRDSFYI